MLNVRHYSFDLAFQYPFTTAKGTKTHQPVFVTSLGLGKLTGYGEAPAIAYHNVTVEGMAATLESKRQAVERYALTDPKRFWHFLHHLFPGENFLITALDMAGWDLFAQLNRKPLYQLLGLKWGNNPVTDYTLGIDTVENMVAKMRAHPWPLYKIKMRKPDDLELLIALRQHSEAAFRVDANEGWSFDDAKNLLPELKKLGVSMIEQPLHRSETEAMKELKAISSIPLFADESCQTEEDIRPCSECFDGVNIKLTKCGGITPALRMIEEGRKLGLKIMVGSMCETTLGSAAIAHMLPLLDEVDADGPLLLKEDIAEGLKYENGNISISGEAGLGIKFRGIKFEK